MQTACNHERSTLTIVSLSAGVGSQRLRWFRVRSRAPTRPNRAARTAQNSLESLESGGDEASSRQALT
jgi:hypothetical protein